MQCVSAVLTLGGERLDGVAGQSPMARRRINRIAGESNDSLLPFPIDAETWELVVKAFALPRQQARVVERILVGMGDKQIARDMKLRPSTVRTYLTRIFDRLVAADRNQITLRVFAQAWTIAFNGDRHQK